MSSASRQYLHALEASEARCRTIIEKNADGIVIVSRDGVVRFVNPAAEALLGRPAQVILGEMFGLPVAPGETTEVDIIRKGEATVAEMRVVETTWEDDTAYLASLRDVSERKRLEEQLRQRAEQLAEADRRKDEFLAMLAHELRNPLGPIRNALHILALPSTSKEIGDTARAVAERQVQHMARLIDDLLDVSRVTSGKIQLRKEILDLRKVIRQGAETMQPIMEDRGIQLTVDLPNEAVCVEGDATRLEQVLMNLLQNAAKYTDRGGKVFLKAEQTAAGVEIRLRDTGVGIDADMLPHIFELFAQVDRSLERSQGGLGIGLTLVKRLVELHGGSVEAWSAGLGHGSEFTIRLPSLSARRPQGDRPNDGSCVQGAPAPAEGKRILLVEDQPDAAEMLESLLQLWGHDVRVARDGLSALSVAQEYHPEVVLLDIGLPGLNGYEVARRLRAEGLRIATLIALTGYGREEDRRLSGEVGFDSHLVKPVDPGRLQKMLASLPRVREKEGSSARR